MICLHHFLWFPSACSPCSASSFLVFLEAEAPSEEALESGGGLEASQRAMEEEAPRRERNGSRYRATGFSKIWGREGRLPDGTFESYECDIVRTESVT